MRAFQFVRKFNGTEATPSGWKTGKATLKSGPDLVEKVWEVWKKKKPLINKYIFRLLSTEYFP